MNFEGDLSEFKPVIIIILLFSVSFLLRAEAYDIGGVPEDLKEFYSDESGLPYYSEMDSYYNYRLTENFIEDGRIEDTVINGIPWDLHSYFPPGREMVYPPMIVYVTAAFYYLMNLFATIPLNVVAFWTGAFVGSLSVIPAYLFARKFTNDYGAVAAGILVANSLPYFSNTFAGFFDNDMFTMLLPLLFIWFFVESIKAPNLQKRVIFGVLSAFSLLIFSLAWVGYIFYLVLLVMVVLVYLLVSRYLLKDDPGRSIKDYTSRLKWFLDQKEIFSLTIVIVLGGLMVGIFNGFNALLNSFFELFGATQIQTAVQATAYPNVYVSVSELQVPSFVSLANGIVGLFLPNQLSMVGGVGGLLVFISGILGLGILLWKMKLMLNSSKDEKKDIESPITNFIQHGREKKRETLFYIILFSLWILMTAYASTRGFRFVAEFSLPIGLSAGIFLGFAVEYIRENIKSTNNLALLGFITVIFITLPLGFSAFITLLIGFILAGIIFLIKDSNLKSTIVMVLVILAVISAPLAGAYALSSSVIPGTNDGMWNSLEWINENTSSDTIITSWWDFGHLFAAVAERPVTFDGGSQNTPRAYWVGQALLSSDEDLSSAIFKMLATSGDEAYLTLDSYTNDSGKSAEILMETLPMDRETALNLMTNEYKLTPEQSQEVLKHSHPEDPTPSIIVTSEDMIGKAGWWTYFGSWDFEANQGTRSMYYPSLASSEPQKINETTVIQTINAITGDMIIGTNLEIIDDEIEANIIVGENEIFQSINPHKLMIIQDGQMIRNEVVDRESALSLLVIEEEGSYNTFIMDKALEDAIFTKLFLLDGLEQNSFELIHEEPGVILWKVI